VFVTLTFSITDLHGQRIRYGYEWPCYEAPNTPPPLLLPEVPTLCQKSSIDIKNAISIGAGTKFPTSATLIKAYTATLNAKDILVTGNFIIDQPILFRACKLKISKDVEITVNPRKRLRSIGSKFFCCDDMWKGINVKEDAAVTLIGKTEIEDAYKAVYATDLSAAVQITGSIFNRNQVGCYFESTQTTGGILTLPSFWGNTFTCTSKLNVKKGYEWPISGMFVSNLMIPTLGDDLGGTANLFTGRITCGIEIEKNSTVVVSNSKFIRINSDAANLNLLPNALIEGYAIKIESNRLRERP
jgi:hypothetical protein